MSFFLIDLKKYSSQEGVYILTPVNNVFEETYLKVREKEKRIYSNEEIEKLPFASANNPHKKEWEIRAKSFLRFKKYLETKDERLNILDLGCGNGWFCGQFSKTFNHNFYCIDVNLTELKQAAKVFKSEKTKFIYADIVTVEIKKNSFDLITINAAVQYFPDLKRLLTLLLLLVKEKGEIHIIDSPFYSENELINAKQRTNNYYSSMCLPQMAENYFHRTWNELSSSSYKILYSPSTFKNKVSKIFLGKDSPFPWICIKKEESTI
jgi:ubiquinone/menaquinone biosynthesis C-methylase UbiE